MKAIPIIEHLEILLVKQVSVSCDFYPAYHDATPQGHGSEPKCIPDLYQLIQIPRQTVMEVEQPLHIKNRRFLSGFIPLLTADWMRIGPVSAGRGYFCGVCSTDPLH